MKAIIPVAGIGVRLRPHTHTQPKALLPIAGKPILAHIVDTLICGGIKEFVFVTGYLGSKIETFIGANYGASGLKIDFVAQEPREGLGHALWSAKGHIKGEKEVLIMLGDTILNLELKKFLASDKTMLGTSKVGTPGNFGVVETDKEGIVKKLVEKPRIPKSNLAMVGIYKITDPDLLIKGIDYIFDNDIKTYGEYQLTDALMYMIEKGEKMVTMDVTNWYDCGKKESLLEANAIMLNRAEFRDTAKLVYPKTIIIPPVSIGNNCRISSSIIGPNVAIGNNTIIAYSIIKNTIVGSFSELQSTLLNSSIIGNDTSLRGHSQSLNIGDNTEINFTE